MLPAALGEHGDPQLADSDDGDGAQLLQQPQLHIDPFLRLRDRPAVAQHVAQPVDGDPLVRLFGQLLQDAEPRLLLDAFFERHLPCSSMFS